MGKGNSSNPKGDETEGFRCLGHSNWTICIPLNHFCSGNIFQLFSFLILEGRLYTRPSDCRNLAHEGFMQPSKLIPNFPSDWRLSMPVFPNV